MLSWKIHSRSIDLACAALCALALCSPPVSMAQSNAEPKQFYRKNFAAGVGQEVTPGEQPESSPGKAGTPAAAALEKEDSGLAEEAPPVSSPGDEAALADQGVEVLAVGAILNSLDEQHYTDSMTELAETAIRFDLPVGEIYTIGDMRSLYKDSPPLFRILARGGRVLVRSGAPKKYKVTKSPSWIIKTAKGEIVLEATGALANNFNQKGEFVDRNARFESVKIAAAEPPEVPATQPAAPESSGKK